MAKKKRKKAGNLTAEDWEHFHETQRMVEERIADHEAKTREEEEAARKSA